MAQAPDISAIPVLHDFFHQHESYERYHVHIIGLVGGKGGNNKAPALKARRNWFGARRLVDAVVDPYVTVSTQGPDTGSTDYFAIGQHKFPILHNCQTPVWDAKCLLIGKKQGTTSLKFEMLDSNSNNNDELILEFTISRDELTETKWTHFSRSPDNAPEFAKDLSFEFKIMVTDGAHRVVSAEQTEAMYTGLFEGHVYSEEVIADPHGTLEGDNALLQCWRHEANTKAVFWVLGRNDCFMHPHVKQALFPDFDVFVVNYKRNGHCRRKGWVSDPHYNSHVPSGTFDSLIPDIEGSLERIALFDKPYDTFLGYAHSTGGPVLLNYVMEKGDAAFDAFLFNSPFMDWGFVGGDMVEFVLENTHLLTKLGAMKNDTKVGAAETPKGLAPISHGTQEIVYSDWSARLWSLYFWEFGARPLYQVPMTVGFAQGVTQVHEKITSWHEQHRVLTAKPFLTITSRGDDVLKSPETLSRADWIGPGRWEIELNDNGHDVFLSYDEADTDMAIDMCRAWLKNQKLA